MNIELARVRDGQYGLNVEVTDNNENFFRNKLSVRLTDYGCIDMDLSQKDRTLFIYLVLNDNFVSYDKADGDNAVKDGDDVFVPFDEEKDYDAYLS
ncbi:unnamed protein product [Rotaria sordida]|uniref:Uncharacterized protein n=1 Tax=Rotaria sordida TaxID=392033 RepID=A0A813NMK0_9BILA|nr:unnamed protein product [Rotaria sordida]